jgi:transcriptional antiterminator RfaH
MEANDKRRWYVVVSKPFAEKTALYWLNDMFRGVEGYESYLPYAVTQRPARKGKVNAEPLVRPLFARHLFVRLDLDVERWKRIFNTQGVSSMLMFGERPLPVRDAVIAEIREREDGELGERLPKNGPQGKNPVIAVEADPVVEVSPVLSAEEILALKTGDQLKVSHLGAEWDAVFKEPVDTKRVSVVLKLLGRDVDVEVTHAQIALREGAAAI